MLALFKIAAASVISTMKVERPPARSSLEPIRVMIASILPSAADFAGTNEPVCASKTICATCRI